MPKITPLPHAPRDAASAPGELIRAEPLPDIMAERPRRKGLAGFALAHPTIVAGLAIILALALAALFAPILGTADPSAISPLDRTLPPSADYWFGTDMAGRDVYSRVIYGARISLMVGFGTAFLASALGLAIGMVAGFVRWSDGIAMRVMDAIMSVPAILLAITLLSVAGGSVVSVILAISIAEFPRVARLVRGQVLALRDLPYVEAATIAGTRTIPLLARHIFPNIVAPLTVQATYICAIAMLIEASLSFVGAGLPPTTPTWGNIMSEGRAIWQVKPSIIFIPAAFLSVTVLAVNLVGDGLRDLFDPRADTRNG